jgi:hypothetical protein
MVDTTLIVAILSGPLTAVFTVYFTSWNRRFKQEKEVIDNLEHELNLNQDLLKISKEKVERDSRVHQPDKLYTSAFDQLRSKGELRLFPYPIRSELTALYNRLNQLNTTLYGDRSIVTDDLSDSLGEARESADVLWGYLNDYKRSWSYEYPLIFYIKKMKRKWRYRARKWRLRLKGEWRERVQKKEQGLEIEYEIPPRTDIPSENLTFYQKSLNGSE